MGIEEVKKIIKVRMHMNKVPGNFKGGGDGLCLLCYETKGSTEHYFECVCVSRLVKIWGVKEEDLTSQEPNKMRAVANFMENVELMLLPKMEKRKEKGEEQTVRSKRRKVDGEEKKEKSRR